MNAKYSIAIVQSKKKNEYSLYFVLVNNRKDHEIMNALTAAEHRAASPCVYINDCSNMKICQHMLIYPPIKQAKSMEDFKSCLSMRNPRNDFD